MNRKMDSTLRHVEESAEQVTAGSENLAQSAQDLAEGATEQAGAVEQLQATMSTITEQVADTVNILMIRAEKQNHMLNQQILVKQICVSLWKRCSV